MNARSRQFALYTIGVVALLASLDALAHSYTGLYGWAVHHRLGGWQALTWPAEIDVFLVAGELALYIAYLDSWPSRLRVWPWLTAAVGLAVSVGGNVGHVTAVLGQSVTIADRVTAAVSPVAAFAGLMIGLLVLKMSRRDTTSVPTAAPAAAAKLCLAENGSVEAHARDIWHDAEQIVREARAQGRSISQRALAARLRDLGHRFSNGQLRGLVNNADDGVI